MNHPAVVAQPERAASSSLRSTPASDIAVNSAHRKSGALLQRFAGMLDQIDCGLLVCVGSAVVYQNHSARLAMQADGNPPTDAGRLRPNRAIDANAIDAVLRGARRPGAPRVFSLCRGDRTLMASVLPLARSGATERDVTLVILGKRQACEELSVLADGMLEETEAFLTDLGLVVAHDRALRTMLFTDIVGSTQLAERLGDERWQRLLERHHAIVRRHLAHFRGQEIDTAGDGFFATFDAPTRAVRCAQAIRGAVRAIGLEIRAGLHTGECEIGGRKVTGVAVYVAARVAATAAAGEILVSSTVKELVAGSGLRFSGGDWHALKGFSDEWRLFALRGGEEAAAGCAQLRASPLGSESFARQDVAGQQPPQDVPHFLGRPAAVGTVLLGQAALDQPELGQLQRPVFEHGRFAHLVGRLAPAVGRVRVRALHPSALAGKVLRR